MDLRQAFFYCEDKGKDFDKTLVYLFGVMKQLNLNTKVMTGLLMAGLVLFIYSLFGRIVHIDDAWIGEQVYWLNEIGVIRNVLMKHFSDNHISLLSYHKAFVYSGLYAVQLFGFSVWVLKSVSLFYLLLFLAIFYYYLVVSRQLVNRKQFGWVALILIIQPHIFEYSFVFRPEVMLMCTGFLVYVFLEKYLQNRNNKWQYVVVAALFAGFGILVHLNGLIFISAGVLLLFWNRKFLAIFIFLPISLAFLYLYFSHLENYADFQLWINSMMSYNTGKNETSGLFSLLSSMFTALLNEHQRYFHSPKEIAFTILIVSSLVVAFKNARKDYPALLVFGLGLILSLGLAAQTKTVKYAIPLIPYAAILVILAAKTLWNNPVSVSSSHQKDWRPKLLMISFLLFLAVSLLYNGLLSNEKFSVKQNQELSDQFVTTVKSQTRVLAPMTFIFDEITVYKEVVGLMSFNERAKTEKRISHLGFFEVADEEDIDYIFLSEDYVGKFKLQELIDEGNNANYRMLGRARGLTVFENKKHEPREN